MKTMLVTVAAAALVVSSATAQPVADHLKCYKVKDAQAKASYTADLGGLVAEPGCIIKVPGNLFCTETTKTNITPTPPGGVDNTGPAGRFLCYKLKCPKATVAPFQWHDQFGDRQLTPSAPKIVCAPEIVATTTTTVVSTTSTTTVASTTTTTSAASTTTTSTTTTLAPGSLCAPCTADSQCSFNSPTFPACVSFPQGRRCDKQCVIDADCQSPANGHCINNECVCTN